MWPMQPMKAIALGIFDGPHATPARRNSGPVFLGISSLNGGRIDLTQSDHVSESDFDKWTRRVTPAEGDLVFSYETRLGEAASIPRGLRCCLGRRMGLVRPNPAKIDPRFLLYAYLGPEFQEVLRERTVQGSTVERILLTEFPEFPIRVPPLPEQRAIAHILGTLDDKIELNRRMNATLEAMAQALFKSWFVDFDGHEDLVESEIGLVPREWDVRPIGEVVKVVGGATPSTQEPSYWDEGAHAWATPKDLSGLTVPILLGTERRITDAGLKRISSGLLPAGTFLLSSRAPIGYTAIAQVPVAINQGFIAIPPGGTLSAAYLLFWTRMNMDSIKGRASGTTFAEISKAAFRPIPVAIPPAERLEEYDERVSALLLRIVANARESQQLTTLRDTLLPKLISGELRVPDAERALEGVL